MNRKYNKEQKETREKIASMLKENTGSHFLDSGGYYGRHWQTNQKREFEKENDATLEIDERGDITVYVNLYHFLCERLTLDANSKKHQKAFEKFAALPENEDDTWADTMNEFVKHIGGKARYAFYTYNEENMLNQDFIGSFFTDKDDNALVFIQIHGGCDARSGFTTPQVFALNYDSELYDYNCATIVCDNHHWWDYTGGYGAKWENDEYPDRLPTLDTFEIVNCGEIDEREPEKMAQQWRGYNALKESPRLPMMQNANPCLPVDGKIVRCDDNTALCPICGAQLKASAPIAG